MYAMRRNTMKKAIVISLALALAIGLTACSKNETSQQPNVEQKSQQTISEANESVCNNENVTDDNLKDYVLCLSDHQLYTEVEEVITAHNKQEDSVMSVLRTYAACMNGSAYTDECQQVADQLLKLHENNHLDTGRMLKYVNAISDKIIAEARSASDKAVQEFNDKYYNPQIGMTKEKVEKSRWGKPSKINKTTTKYGVQEQWVYSGGRYVYFEDGVVTAIQE
jgi:hypothetical protein